ncbi:ethanolamine utilization protein EutP [Heliobacterium gestii]|uniref:Ethanolamine utilization protein EutP n=1 Tax=Heliomicrobium gestii TaxID=2699 RepID=A0A845LAR1_HELGE|nr:EutP/PduV family microcompartment system protein [Heliomicrobium gestii]MBM7866971.1 ethanolamine utilization protein EutP [Heliomicrobium gestii]MZP42394.1 ethanolamine utilization protein EutP [Heliomicrobium gestii]
MKRVMLIGTVGAGKTTLIQALQRLADGVGEGRTEELSQEPVEKPTEKPTEKLAEERSAGKAAKTQMILYHDSMIDTPGEYIQSPRFYAALQVTAADAAMILLVHDGTKRSVSIPPGFAGMFACPVIGVVTKIDRPEADQQTAAARLKQAGIKESMFFVSARTGEGLAELHTFLAERGCNHG